MTKDSFLSHFEKPAGGSAGEEEDEGEADEEEEEDGELIADHESATVCAVVGVVGPVALILLPPTMHESNILLLQLILIDRNTYHQVYLFFSL